LRIGAGSVECIPKHDENSTLKFVDDTNIISCLTKINKTEINHPSQSVSHKRPAAKRKKMEF